MTNKITIPFCFTSDKAKEIYDNKPPQYATERASGFDLRILSMEYIIQGNICATNYLNQEIRDQDVRFCQFAEEFDLRFSEAGSLFLKDAKEFTLPSMSKILIKTGIRVALPLLKTKEVHWGWHRLPSGHYLAKNDTDKSYHTQRQLEHIEKTNLVELQIRSLAEKEEKQGLVVACGIKTIDNDNTSELYFILHNISSETQEIKLGDRIAQGVLNPLMQAEFQEYSQEEFEKKFCKSDRGSGGFGSTGSN